MLSKATRRIWPLVLATSIALGLVGCTDTGSTDGSTVISDGDRPFATPTPLRIGTEETSPLAASIVRLHHSDPATPIGAALVLTSDGFLLTHTSTLESNIQVSLPDGSSLRPVRVAIDEPSELALLKIPATGLAAIHLSEATATDGDEVFAAGWDESTSSYGEIAGRVQKTTIAHGTDDAKPEQILSDIPVIPGFIGGALADNSGAVMGIIGAGVADDGKHVLSATPIEYLLTWINTWRSEAQQIAAEGGNWPVLQTKLGVALRFPVEWALASEDGDDSSFQGEITPGDPDVPLRLSVSIQSISEPIDPLEFVEREFGATSNAMLWGEVSHAGLNGARLRLSQEGARVDIVYLFSGTLQIAVSLTSGYGVNDTGPAAQRATALFDVLLESITIQSAGQPEPVAARLAANAESDERS